MPAQPSHVTLDARSGKVSLAISDWFEALAPVWGNDGCAGLFGRYITVSHYGSEPVRGGGRPACPSPSRRLCCLPVNAGLVILKTTLPGMRPIIEP